MAERKRGRQEYQQGLYGYHDPTAGLGGAAPTVSALTARLWLAGVGIVLCVGAAIVAFILQVAWVGILLLILAATAVVDFVWVAYRKHRGEPG